MYSVINTIVVTAKTKKRQENPVSSVCVCVCVCVLRLFALINIIYIHLIYCSFRRRKCIVACTENSESVPLLLFWGFDWIDVAF